MNTTIFFSICSLFYCLLFIIMIFKKNNNSENKLLKVISIINLITLLCESLGVFLGSNYEKYQILNDISLRLMLITYIIWFSMFTLFIVNVSNKNISSFTIEKKVIISMMILAIVISLFLPIVYNTNDNGIIIYTSGMAVQLVYYYAMVSEMISLLIMFKNIKNVKLSNYTSLFVLVIMSTLAAAIQSYYPELLLTASTETFVMYVAYYNIKNKEVVKNKIEEIKK